MKEIIMQLFLTLSIILLAHTPLYCSGGAASKRLIDVKSNNEKPWIVKTGEQPQAITFSPNGKLVAVVNRGSNNINVYTVDLDAGTLAQIKGSPFSTAESPRFIKFSGNGKWLAVASFNADAINLYAVDASTGQLTLKPKSSIQLTKPISLAFSPDDTLIIGVSMHSFVSATKFDPNTAHITPVSGSPFAKNLSYETGASVVFSDTGNFVIVADSTLNVYRVDTNTGKLAPIQGSPFANSINSFHKDNFLTLSPKNWLFTLARSNKTLAIYKFDTLSGKPIAIKEPSYPPTAYTSISFSPNGKLFVGIAQAANKIFADAVVQNEDNINLSPAQGSPFQTGRSPSAIAFSPVMPIAAVINQEDNTAWVYKIDEQTGEFTPITGEPFSNKKSLEVSKKVLEEIAQNDENENKALGASIPDPIFDILSDYLVGPKTIKSVLPAETQTDKEKEIDKMNKQKKASPETGRKLFEAIKETDDTKKTSEFLNPFTINQRAENNNTPLIVATLYGRIETVKKLINYKGNVQENLYHIFPHSVELYDVNYDGNNALMTAIIAAHFDIALILTKAMIEKDPEKLCANNKKRTYCS